MSYKSVKDKNNQCRLHVSNTSQFDNNLSFVGVRGNLSNKTVCIRGDYDIDQMFPWLNVQLWVIFLGHKQAWCLLHHNVIYYCYDYFVSFLLVLLLL